MANIQKPVILDETGQQILTALEGIKSGIDKISPNPDDVKAENVILTDSSTSKKYKLGVDGGQITITEVEE